MKDETGKPTGSKDDTRVQTILQAAMQVFALYGYRKTSMQDVARAAHMSRPALYQYFRNKEDIYRKLTQSYFETACAEIGAALRDGGTPEEALSRAFRAKLAGMEILTESPHGEELLELGQSVAGAEMAEGMARLNAVMADWLEQARASGQVRFDGAAGDTARVILAALDVVKRPPFDTVEGDLMRLAALFGRGLAP